MTIIYAKHEAYDHRIGKIVKEMRELGPPKLRAVLFEGELFALEGSHRLASADYLGLVPEIILEKTESDTALDIFWKFAKERLPKYEFEGLKISGPF